MFSNRDPKKNNKRKYLQCFYNLCRDVSLRKKEKKKEIKNAGISLIREIQTSINIRLTIPL